MLMSRRFYTLSLGVIFVFVVIIWLKASSQRLLTASNSSGSTADDTAMLGAESQRDSRVKASVFYEVLCPDSMNFVVSQLWPTYNTIGSILNLDLVPYGKASYTAERGSYRFDCQHGPQECQGNKIHSCVLNSYPNISRALPFIQCSLAASDPVAASQQCAENNGLDWRLISECADGARGNDLLHANGVRTEALNPRMVFVPWILINDVYTSEQEEQSLSDFMAVVCTAYKGEKPLECLG